MITDVLLPLVKWLRSNNVKQQVHIELPSKVYEMVEKEVFESAIYANVSEHHSDDTIIFQELVTISKDD